MCTVKLQYILAATEAHGTFGNYSLKVLKLPGVSGARRVQGFAGHDPPKLSLSQRLLEHQAAARELKLLVNLETERVGVNYLSEWKLS